MKIKLSKSQWEEMGKKAGWDFYAEQEQRQRVKEQKIRNIDKQLEEVIKSHMDIGGGGSRQNTVNDLIRLLQTKYQ